MTLEYTRYFRFGIPNFRSSPWHADWEQLVRDIDRIMYGMLVNVGISVWTNDTDYKLSDLAIDETTRVIYMADVIHTSALTPTTFAEDRAAHPTYWKEFALTGALPAIRVIIGNSVVVADADDYIVFNKAAPAPSTVELLSIASRHGHPVVIIDRNNNAGDIVVSPQVGETIGGNPTLTMGSGTKAELVPSEALNDWLVKAG